MKSNKLFFGILGLLLIVAGYLFAAPFLPSLKLSKPDMSVGISEALAAKFENLSKNGNSSCSAAFKDSITSMPDGSRLQGSCCSPMDMHRYSEQVEGLKKYKKYPEIPSDPYDIDSGLAKQMLAHYDDQLTSDQQQAYDYAMQNSKEKGPCCCKCWRWYVYGGLAKVLITKYHFTGQQITEVWNLSDGCGGNG